MENNNTLKAKLKIIFIIMGVLFILYTLIQNHFKTLKYKEVFTKVKYEDILKIGFYKNERDKFPELTVTNKKVIKDIVNNIHNFKSYYDKLPDYNSYYMKIFFLNNKKIEFMITKFKDNDGFFKIAIHLGIDKFISQGLYISLKQFHLEKWREENRKKLKNGAN